jgi:hypothetical protein
MPRALLGRFAFVGRHRSGENTEPCEAGPPRENTPRSEYQCQAELEARGITFVSLRDNLDLSTPCGRLILNVKREPTSWGAHKIRERLSRRFSGIEITAKSTIHSVLDRHCLVEPRGRCVLVLREPRYPSARIPMNCGVPITRPVLAGEPSILLSADRHRPCQPLSVVPRGPFLHQGRICLYRV